MNIISNKTTVEERVEHILNTHGIAYTARYDESGHLLITMNLADVTSALWYELKSIEQRG